MPFEKLRAHYAAQRRYLRNGRELEDLLARLSGIYQNVASSDSFAEAVGTITATRENERGLVKGMGPEEKVGRQGRAPRGTIRQFLQDYPEFRRKNRGGDKSTAWRRLPPVARIILQEEREQGRYGGAEAAGVGKVPYFFPQDQSLAPWQQAGEDAAIPGKYELNDAIEGWRERVVPQVLAQFRRRLRAL